MIGERVERGCMPGRVAWCFVRILLKTGLDRVHDAVIAGRAPMES